MISSEFLKEIGGIDIAFDVPLEQYTTFRIGGNADVLINIKNTEELCLVLRSAKNHGVPFFVLGKGSNLLVSDKGIEGAVISLSALDVLEVDGETVTCGAGAKLSTLCVRARDAGLSGLEFAFGIPGSVGGALFMNAGAYGGEMSQVVLSAECVDFEGNTVTVSKDEMCLGYRSSIFKSSDLIITSVTFGLKRGDKAEIDATMQELIGRRRDKQPLEYPSAGSTFKRPEGYFAGALIEKNGLKGASVGGAEVSVKHAGFVINKGDATCADVLSLIKKIQDAVFEADGVHLETEVIFVGRPM